MGILLIPLDHVELEGSMGVLVVEELVLDMEELVLDVEEEVLDVEEEVLDVEEEVRHVVVSQGFFTFFSLCIFSAK
jgi:hypothetical protein